MASVTLDRVRKSFGPATAVDGVSLEVASGEFVALLGPSGCGKTTLLRLVAGFEAVSDGRIALDGAVLSAADTHVPTEQRNIGMVFQSYALWPHMTVWENVAFALRIRRLPRSEVSRRVQEALAMVGLDALARRRPAALSGGQRQRVALARCLAMDPRLVLLDEPLANLDAHLRETMQGEFKAFHRRTGATMLYVTHDQAEALALADRIAVMMGGRLRQVASPRVLYGRPADADVARFIGKGAVVRGHVRRVQAAGDDSWCDADVQGTPMRLRCRTDQPTGAVDICLRPEGLRLGAMESGGGSLQATVTEVVYQGPRQEVTVALRGGGNDPLRLWHGSAADPLQPGSAVPVNVTDGWVIGPAAA